MNKQVISTIIGSREYTIENTGSVGVTLTNYNGKVYLNGMEVPDDTGEFRIKSLPKVKIKIREVKNRGFTRSFNMQKTVSKDTNNKKINLSKEDDVKIINDDYIISGMGQSLVGYNIHVYGDVVISGMNNRVVKDRVNNGLKNIVIKGDLIINGMSNTVRNLVECRGDIVNSGMNNMIM